MSVTQTNTPVDPEYDLLPQDLRPARPAADDENAGGNVAKTRRASGLPDDGRPSPGAKVEDRRPARRASRSTIETKRSPTARKIEPHRLLTTAEYLSRNVPGCDTLQEEFDFADGRLWAGPLDDDIAGKLRTSVRKRLNSWLRKADKAEILKVRSRLNPACFGVIRDCIHIGFRGFFEHSGQAIPNALAAPSPFLLLNRNDDARAGDRPLIRQYGKTTMRIGGALLHAEDLGLTVALNLIRNRSKVRITEKNAAFKTSLIEIAKELRKGNPYARSTKEAIRRGLERLRSCVLTLINKGGHFYIGGILDGALLVGDGDDLTIYMDRTFINLFDAGFVSIEDHDEFFRLSPKAQLVLIYLRRQKTFNTTRRLTAVSIAKVADYSGLSGGTIHRPEWEKGRRVAGALDELRHYGLVGPYAIEDGKLKISRAARRTPTRTRRPDFRRTRPNFGRVKT